MPKISTYKIKKGKSLRLKGKLYKEGEKIEEKEIPSNELKRLKKKEIFE